MKRTAALITAILLLANAAAAQLGRDKAAELAALQRGQKGKAAEIEQLVDRRFRLDMGLKVEEDPTLRHSTPMSTVDRERRMRELFDLEGATQTYNVEYSKIKRQLESLRAEVEAQAAAEREREQFIDVPAPGAMQPSATGPVVQQAGDYRANVQPQQPVQRQSSPVPGEDLTAVETGPVRGRIRGSTDHLRVAQSLFEAGHEWMARGEEARKRGDVELARERDDLAKERLERALDELEPLLANDPPDYAVLFCQGRSLELLFHHSVLHDGLSLQRSARVFQQREQKVRAPFVSVSARDVQKGGAQGEIEVLGPWGKAAQAALEHFRWMNLHADFEPKTSIDSLTWPGEKDR